MPYIGEWAQAYFRIPNAEYHALANAFNPILFDADEWIRLAADAGMKYIVVTAKHHEGFAMFHSRVSKFNVVDATPFGRDVIYELANACARHGVRLGLYYSQDLDWSEPNGGGYTAGRTWCGGAGVWTNDWDFPDNAHKDYAQCFESKIKPQVTELLTGYGDLCLIWFDTPRTISAAQSQELVDLVHRHQPNCLITPAWATAWAIIRLPATTRSPPTTSRRSMKRHARSTTPGATRRSTTTGIARVRA